MKTAHWNNQQYTNIDANLSTEEIQATLAELVPPIANATARVDGDNIYFEVRSGSKG